MKKGEIDIIEDFFRGCIIAAPVSMERSCIILQFLLFVKYFQLTFVILCKITPICPLTLVW